jgi:hypothetical protein
VTDTTVSGAANFEISNSTLGNNSTQPLNPPRKVDLRVPGTY